MPTGSETWPVAVTVPAVAATTASTGSGQRRSTTTTAPAISGMSSWLPAECPPGPAAIVSMTAPAAAAMTAAGHRLSAIPAASQRLAGAQAPSVG